MHGCGIVATGLLCAAGVPNAFLMCSYGFGIVATGQLLMLGCNLNLKP